MLIYRITLAKWSKKLVASGNPARWNTKGKFVIYTASTRALACLENFVHRSGEGLNQSFRVMVISVPPKIKIEKVELSHLPADWNVYTNNAFCQNLGDKWYNENKVPILRVPSVIIQEEFNYLLNPNHSDFPKIKLLDTENFFFDSRLKGLSGKK